MDELALILVLLLGVYVAFGIMVIGFGYMVAGKIGGSRVAAFYFGRPLRWAGQRVRSVLAWTLTCVGLVLIWMIRTLADRFWHGMRWLVGTRGRMTVTVAIVFLCALTFVALASIGPAGAHTVTIQVSIGVQSHQRHVKAPSPPALRFA